MGHSAAEHRKTYWKIFVWLFVLTVLEVGLVYVPGISKALLVAGLVGMAVVKAALVGWYYMHLNDESVGLKWTVAIPMGIPAFYACVLIAEASWRYLR
jgi:caa(3)-type oxidase subunit IV